jgi:hypothetical protein
LVDQNDVVKGVDIMNVVLSESKKLYRMLHAASEDTQTRKCMEHIQVFMSKLELETHLSFRVVGEGIWASKVSHETHLSLQKPHEAFHSVSSLSFLLKTWMCFMPQLRRLENLFM